MLTCLCCGEVGMTPDVGTGGLYPLFCSSSPLILTTALQDSRYYNDPIKGGESWVLEMLSDVFKVKLSVCIATIYTVPIMLNWWPHFIVTYDVSVSALVFRRLGATGGYVWRAHPVAIKLTWLQGQSSNSGSLWWSCSRGCFPGPSCSTPHHSVLTASHGKGRGPGSYSFELMGEWHSPPYGDQGDLRRQLLWDATGP